MKCYTCNRKITTRTNCIIITDDDGERLTFCSDTCHQQAMEVFAEFDKLIGQQTKKKRGN
jgi:alpha-D-ribose 1-methylphosphonate 5-phosphate C-P lyase